jgi:SIR2-like domain
LSDNFPELSRINPAKGIEVMEINTHDSCVPYNEATLESALGRITTGRAILFTGAGFSVGTKNVNGCEPPRAADLALLIAKLGGFEDDSDLSYVADYYIENYDKKKLIDLLKRHYTIINTSESHEIIGCTKWKRIYTTNYDNSIELSAAKAGKIIDCITLENEPKKYFKESNICIHINGAISTLEENTLNSSFKLSHSSYISPDSFTSSSWYYPFKKDLEQCSAIIFIGYSLYDMEIQKLLFSCAEFKEKTYFIISKTPSKKEVYSLSKFGTVFPIGVDIFANRLSEATKNNQQVEPELWTGAFHFYENSDSEQEMRDSDINDFLLYGNIKSCHIDDAMSKSTQTFPYLVVRDEIERASNWIRKNRNVVIISEFGNGKSIFIKQLMSNLAINGNKVFYLSDIEGDYIDDLEKLSSLESEAILMIDGYEKCFDLIEYFGKVNPENIKLVLSSRTVEHERFRNELRSKINFDEICIDILSESEIYNLIQILDNMGWWGNMASYSLERKKQVVIRNCKSQISILLLHIFNAPQIKERINQLTKSIFSVSEFKDTMFAICLLEVLDLPLKYSLISEISNHDHIYSGALHSNTSFRQIFSLGSGQVNSKSSILSMSLLKNHFSPAFVVEKLLGIAQKYETLKSKNSIENQIGRELLRFSSIERILSDQGKKNNLIRYYEELKTRIPWLKREPHYWLQYAMARITFSSNEEYDKAEGYLSQAYALARTKDDYDTSSIDVQQARIYLLRASDETDGTKSFKYFFDAHKLLLKANNNIYKFRQVYGAYQRLFDEKYCDYSIGQKVQFEHACKKMKKDLDAAEFNGSIRIHDQKVISVRQQLTSMLEVIERSR